MLDLTTFGLTEEQMAEINSEIDRRCNQASQTARANAEKKFDEKLPELVNDAVQKATVEASKTAEEKAADEWTARLNKLEETLAQATHERNVFANEARIREAGITDAATVQTFASMFANNSENLDSFLTAFNNSVDNRVKAAQADAVNNVTLPGATTGGQSHAQPLSQAAISKMVEGNVANNGGYLDDAQLFADIRAAQQ